ncbi:MAG: hypothetical protein E7212_05935 [Clostridium sartagoforme]|nr:hypothetical protein [Clostridium sartagoforme]
MNKKIYTITLLVILMFLITSMRNLFITDIKKVAISNNNIESFNKYILREGKYSLSLPEGWDIDSKSNDSSDIITTFNNNEDIYGSISIMNIDKESIYKNIKGDTKSIRVIEEDYKWINIIEGNGKNISNYYVRDYSEGKVLIIKFSYTEGKEKNSIKIVFDYIANSFI